MRASTLFAVTIAILLGLAAAITVKVTGYINSPKTDVAAPKTPEIAVLVAARNIFKGDMIDGGWVQVRMLRAEEIKDYEANKDKYLPPVPNAAVMRITATDIEADKPIVKDHLIPLGGTKPGTISSHLLPNMRAVDLMITKDNSAGGLIQPGEWVDVMFTSQITVNGITTTRTAPIAHKLRVIAKRNTLWPIFGPLTDPVPFTLEMNPYRAALVNYCKGKGVLSLVPVSAAEQKTLEDRRVAMFKDKDLQQVAFVPPGMEADREYSEEDQRVDAINDGKASVGTRDLMRIFDLQTKQPPLADTTEKPVAVEIYIGNKAHAHQKFNKDGSVYVDPYANQHGVIIDPANGNLVAAPKPIFQGPQTQSGVDFSLPEMQFQMPGEKPGCKNCKKKKEEGSGVQ